MSEASVSEAITIRGAVDLADTNGLVRGWCWSPDEPEVQRTIQLLQDGELVATVLCDFPRPGLVRAGIGNGRNAFDFVIPQDEAELREGSVIAAVDTATGITFAETVVTPPVAEQQPATAKRDRLIEGHLDGVSSSGTVHGWCWFPDEPSRHAEIVVVVDSEPVGTVRANLYRSDLHEARVGEGDHSIVFELPETALAGKPVVNVSLYEASDWTMIGEPIAVPINRPGELPPDLDPEEPAALELPIEGSLDGVTPEGVVTGWSWYPSDPSRHVEVRIMVDDMIAATVTAGSYRLDLQEAGIGKGDHGVVAVLPWESIADKRLSRITFHEVATDRLIGKPFLLRRRGMAVLDQRVRELEQQVRLLRSRLEETAQLRAAGYDQATRELFQTIGSFFNQLADGQVADGSAGLRALLAEVSETCRPLHLAAVAAPQATICIDGTAPIEAMHACLAALQAARADRVAEIVVIDDGRFEELALLPSVVRNLDYYRLAPGQGLVAGRNEAAFNGRGEIVVFLTPDLRVTETWLAPLLETLVAVPRAAVADSRVVRDDGGLQHGGWLLAEDGALREAALPAPGLPRPIDALADYAFAVRRSAFEAVGGFDLAFAAPAAASFDLGLRLRAAGHALLHQPQALVRLSPQGGTTRSLQDIDLTLADEDMRRLRLRWFSGDGATPLPAPVEQLGLALFIDTVLPRPDQDAGSLATVQQMLLLQRLGYHVCFAAIADPGDEPARATALQRMGVELIAPPHYESVTEFLAARGDELNLVVAYRHSNLHGILPRLQELAPQARRVFVPCDLHYLREQRAGELIGAVNETLVQHIRDEELACVQGSDATILASDHEVDLLRPDAAGKRLTLLRWITRVEPPMHGFAERSGLCFVAGFAHAPNEDALIWFAREVMPLVTQEAPEIRLHVVGSQMPAAVRALASPHVVVHGWLPDLVPLFESVRLSIAPLRFGAGFKGKVATALAHGVPVVGTPIALEGTGLQQDDGVLIASTAAEFAQAVLLAHNNATLWRRLSARAIERCNTLYSETAGLRVFRDMLADLGLPLRS